MKKVLFISVTKYDLKKNLHLKEKFEGLSQKIKPYILAKGWPLHQKIWGAEFYLLPPSLFWFLAPSFAFWLSLSKKIDTFVCQGPLLEGLLGTVLKRMLGKELIVEIHGDWEERIPSFKKVLTFFARISLRNADKIRGVANYLILKAKKFAPQKSYFLFPTFTDLNAFLKEKETRFEDFVLFVGRADRIKGVKYLIEAFDKIKDEFPEFRLTLVGEGLPEGKLSLAETKKIMKNCYCLVLPSLSEGLPRVIMEAMALSKPVVASRVGGISDLIHDGQNGFLFEVGDSNELAEKLRILLNNKNLAREMGKKGKEFIQNRFSNEKYINNYLEMINS